jgi:hypothetical protein
LFRICHWESIAPASVDDEFWTNRSAWILGCRFFLYGLPIKILAGLADDFRTLDVT